MPIINPMGIFILQNSINASLLVEHSLGLLPLLLINFTILLLKQLT
jgi:hypothetical protein